MGSHLMSKHLMGRRLMGKHLIGKHLLGKHLMGSHLVGKHLLGKHLMGKHLMGSTRAHYLSYLQKREGEARKKKRRQSDWLANQIDRKVMDGQVIDRLKTDRQVETRPMSADIQADRAAS